MPPRLEQSLFCEDARVEVSGQVTLVGFFPGDTLLLANDGPFQLPKLSYVLVLSRMRGVVQFQLQTEVQFNGREVIQRLPPTEHDRGGTQADIHTIVQAFSPFQGSGPGEYVFRATINLRPTTFTFSRKIRCLLAPQSGSPVGPS